MLQFLARHGRWVLVVGLVMGVLLPGLAAAMKAWLPEMVAMLLFISALRIGPKEAFGRLNDFPQTLSIVLIYQIAVPLLLLLFFYLIGLSGSLAFAIVLMASASSIAGGANLTLMTGNAAGPALRLLIVGTALLPLTVLPVFWFLPELGSVQTIILASGRLLMIIALATIVAFAIRHFLLPAASDNTLTAIDGVSAIAMAVVVIGLMSAVAPALNEEPWLLATTLFAACAANFGLQIVFWIIWGRAGVDTSRAAYSIVSGNRNMALFLAALPVVVTDPILLFIGCYQIPMYLTPLVLGKLYRR